jgi:hypothetical protein
MAAPTPAAPAGVPVAPASLPVDPAYDAAVGSSNQSLATTLAALTAQRQQIGQTYGLRQEPTGNVIDDPTNPFSRAAALQLAYRQSQRGNTTSMAARGQLYSGSLQNAQNESTRQNQSGRDALIREFQARNADIDTRTQQAKDAFAAAQAQAEADRAARALAARPDAAEAGGPAPAGAPPKGAGPSLAAQANFRREPGRDSRGNRGVWHIYPDGRRVFVRG